MKTIEDLAQERATLLATAKQEYHDAADAAEEKGETVSDQDESALDAGLAKVDALDKRIDRLNRLRASEAVATTVVNPLHGQPGSGNEFSESRTVGATLNGDGTGHRLNLDSDYMIPATAKRGVKYFESGEDAFKAGQWVRAAIFGHKSARDFCDHYGMPLQAALNEGTNTAGGFLVPDPLLSTILDLREEYGVFRRFAKVQPMASETANIPRKTGGLTATPMAELASITESEGAWDVVGLVARKWGVLTRLSNEVAEDAIINLAQDVASDLALAFATAEDNAGFIGDGTSTYHGISGLETEINLAAHAGSVHTALSGNIKFGNLDLVDFESMVGKLPRFPGLRAVWHISQEGWAASMLRLLDAAGGNTSANLAAGITGKFLGFDVVINNSMNSDLTDDVAAIKLFLGDLRMSSLLGDRRGLSVATSTERYFDTDELAIRGIARFDINNHSLGSATVAGPVIAMKTPAS